MERFREQLKRQVKFLINSCEAFDNGDVQEAIRIATCIRVLVHDTRRSTSVLEHLNAKGIKLFSTSPKFPESKDGYQCFTAFNMGVLTAGPKKFGYLPNLEDFKPESSDTLPINEWWDQIVWNLSSEHKMSRKRIILSATNQDGGSHVDKKLNDDYKELTVFNAGTLTVKINGQTLKHEIGDVHLCSIRTIANELLKSPEFFELLH